MYQKIVYSLSFLLLFNSYIDAQEGTLKGIVLDESGKALVGVNIIDSVSRRVSFSDGSGQFKITLLANVSLKITFSFIGYTLYQIELLLKNNETKVVTIQLRPSAKLLDKVNIISTEKAREEASTTEIDPETIKNIPTPFGDFNQALISGGALGIVSNNELSANYAVRGGNFDENLVYVNNIPIYRPVLAKSGTQEGLSFVNPDLVSNIVFSSGGWQPKYGDKLSSVLNIRYKTPKQYRASLNLNLLGATIHVEGASKNRRITCATGMRYKSANYLLNTLETQGEYLPRFLDIQTFINFDISGKNRKSGITYLSLLFAYTQNDYRVIPTTRETTFGFFSDVRRFIVAFEGQESLNYRTLQGGLKLKHRFSQNFASEFIASSVYAQELEFTNLEGRYRLCDVDTDINSATFNQCILVRGVGTQFNYGRNLLYVNIFNFDNRNKWWPNKDLSAEFGIKAYYREIDDTFYEYAFTDSVGFTNIDNFAQNDHNLGSFSFNAYYQQTHFFSKNSTITYGARATYWQQNKQWLFSPRLQYAFKPDSWKSDIVFNAALGLYRQPPFYRELRNFQGILNQNLKAQNSLHAVVGIDYNFQKWNRPFKLTTELYYKYLWKVIIYDVDNIRLRYYGNNDALARVLGVDIRLSGEIIPDTDSWISVSILSAQEDYLNDDRGYIRRPSDQRVTFAMFFEDHFPNNPTIKIFIRALYGSGLPYGPPNALNFRSALSTNANYRRIDVGFSKQIHFNKNEYRKKISFQSLWLGLEILNLTGENNTISFTWIEDFANRQFAVPNNLSQRFFNFKMRLKI